MCPAYKAVNVEGCNLCLWYGQGGQTILRLQRIRHYRAYQGNISDYSKLHFLHFPWNELRGLDKKIMKRLKEAFKTYDCRRLEPRNYIAAIVDRQQLDAAIERSPNVGSS